MPSVNAVIAHEFQHLEQERQVIEESAATSIWRMLDEYAVNEGDNADFYTDFVESDAYRVELLNEEVGWLHHIEEDGGMDAIGLFNYHYELAKTNAIMNDNGDEMARSRSFLQEIYIELGDQFQEIVRPDITGSPAYDFWLRSPE